MVFAVARALVRVTEFSLSLLSWLVLCSLITTNFFIKHSERERKLNINNSIKPK